MLNAFQVRLRQLALDPKDPFTRIVRKIAGPKAAPEFENGLRQMILETPAMIRQVGIWADNPAQPEETKRLHAFLFRYLFHPSDFLSERNLGFFGYVDDAYIVASVYRRTLEKSEKLESRPVEEEPKIAGSVKDWLNLCRRLLPDETRKMDAVLDEFRYYNDKGFLWAIQKAARGTPLSRKLEKEMGR